MSHSVSKTLKLPVLPAVGAMCDWEYALWSKWGVINNLCKRAEAVNLCWKCYTLMQT